MKMPRNNSYLPFVLLTVPVLWLGALAAGCYEEGMTVFDLMACFNSALEMPWQIVWTPYTLKAMLTALLLYGFALAMYFSAKENRRPGEEHGSAKWGSARELNAKYRDKRLEQNTILSQNIRMGLDGKKHRRNLLQIIIGGSGSGKTRFFCKPNLMQANCSFIVTDPKGEMLRSVAPLLLKRGYAIKVFDLIDPSHSDAFNPLLYIKDDTDAMKLVNNLIKNTTPKNAGNNDPFWEKSEIALDTALILYLIHEAPPEEQTFEMVMYMIENGGAKEDDDDFQTPLDLLFEALGEEEPDHIAVREYKVFKQAAGKTARSILISAAVRLSAFILPQIVNITCRDDMELGQMGERKQAVFAVIPDNDSTFNYLVGMLYTCAFQSLYYQADKVHQGGLPVPVRLMMDEFCNVSLPDDFGKLQATMRSRNIMSTIVLQNISALKALFKDDWEGLIGNADTMIYLGGNEHSTHKYISEMLGKETLDTRSQTISRGSHGSSSINHQQTGRELLTPDEVRAMDNAYEIVFIRGERPVIDRKYDILQHPNIKLTEDGGAAPYVHKPQISYVRPDLSLFFDSLDDVEILADELLDDERSEQIEDKQIDELEENI